MKAQSSFLIELLLNPDGIWLNELKSLFNILPTTGHLALTTFFQLCRGV